MEDKTVFVSYEEVTYDGRDTFVDLVLTLHMQLRLAQGHTDLVDTLKEKFKHERYKLEVPLDWEVRIAKHNMARRRWTEEIVTKLRGMNIPADSLYTRSSGWHVLVKPSQDMFLL